MRRELAGGVFAHRHRLDIDARHIDALFQDLHSHKLRHILRHDDWAEWLDAFAFRHQVFQAAREQAGLLGDIAGGRHADQRRQAIVDRQFFVFVRRQLRWDDGYIVGGHIEGQARVVAVENRAASRRNRQFAQAILVGARLVFAVALHLQLVHTNAKNEEDRHNHRLEEGQAPSLEGLQAIGFHSRPPPAGDGDNALRAEGEPGIQPLLHNAHEGVKRQHSD